MASADFSQFVVTTVPFGCAYSFSACEISPGTHTFFHPYTRHVYRKRFRAVIGLWLLWQSYPRLRPDMIPVRRVRVLPPPSFRFRLATDTLGLGYDLPTAGRSRDFHPLERALAGRTTERDQAFPLRGLISFFPYSVLPVRVFLTPGSISSPTGSAGSPVPGVPVLRR